MIINKKYLKRRLAICENCFGNHSHFFIKGQVIDLSPKKKWIASILKKSSKVPISDFFHSPVISPILKIKIRNKNRIFIENEIEGDKLGFFSFHYENKLRTGAYFFEIYFQKLNSYLQYTKDILLQVSKEHTYELIGKGNLTIFSERKKHIFLTSDIDQTYLDTKMTAKGMLETIIESPDEKVTLPKMDSLYKDLQKEKNTHLLFISASPYFFKRTFHNKFKQDGLEITNIRLKYENSIFYSTSQWINLAKSFSSKIIFDDIQTVQKSFETALKSTFHSFFNHISYKLIELLKNRLYFPTKIEQILVGDDTEHDPLIFSLYQILLMGKLLEADLLFFLENFKIDKKIIFKKSKIMQLKDLVEKCILHHGTKNTVKLVLINKSRYGRKEEDIRNEIMDILPKELYKMEGFRDFQVLEGAKEFSKALSKANFLPKKLN